MNRASGTCGTTTNNLTFVSLDSWEKKKENNEKVLDFLKTKKPYSPVLCSFISYSTVIKKGFKSWNFRM